MKNSISIIIPAYNEEKNLISTVENTKKALKKLSYDYEILIFDDCSTDKTGLIADELAKKDNRIKAIHNPKNMGMGYSYINGVRLASKYFIMWVPGDDDIPFQNIMDILKCIGKADIINPYFTNPFEVRAFHRVIISKSFVKFMNMLMGLDLKYYSGPVIYKSKLIKNIKINSHSFAYQAEILSKLLKSGHSFMEIGIKQTGKGTGSSHFYTFKNMMGIFKTILYLFWDTKIKNRKKYNKKPVRMSNQNQGNKNF